MTADKWNADDYASHAAFVPQLTTKVLQDLSPKQGERILDLGCGDGVLAQEVLKSGCTLVGVDTSPGLVEAARRRNVDARLADAQEVEFFEEFDAVFSNAALHWMPRQRELSRRVYRSLKPGGRFVAEMGGKGNIARLCKALNKAMGEFGLSFAQRNPWTFPDPSVHAEMLASLGFDVRECALRARPTPLPTNLQGWLVTFTQQLLEDLDGKIRSTVIDRTVELCQPELRSSDGTWVVDYVRLNFTAIKPLQAA